MNYIVTGLRPDGSVGLQLTCTTQDLAKLQADLCRVQHPDWKISIRMKPGSSATIDGVNPNA